MTVYRIGRNKIKISLSDGEVRSYFGKYENISSLSGNAKLIVGMLLEESLNGFGFDNEEKLLVEIKAVENSGCIIIISSAQKERVPAELQKIMLEFSDSDSLIQGILRLSRIRPKHRTESFLYKMPQVYRLIIKNPHGTDYFFMNEYCIHQSDSALETAYTEEHGKLLIEKNAIEKICTAFSKGF